MENASAPEPRLARELGTIPHLPFRRGEDRGEGAAFALGRLAAGGACGRGLPPAARERDDGKSSPGFLAARFAVLFSGERYPLLGWRLAFIGDFPSSLSELAVIMAQRAGRPQGNLRPPSAPSSPFFGFADNASPVPQSVSANLTSYLLEVGCLVSLEKLEEAHFRKVMERTANARHPLVAPRNLLVAARPCKT